MATHQLSETSKMKRFSSLWSGFSQKTDKISRQFYKSIKSATANKNARLFTNTAIALVTICTVLILLAFFSFLTFPTSTKKQQEGVNRSLTFFETDRRGISIAVVASRKHGYSDVHLTLLSANALGQNIHVQLVHFADAPDPEFAALTPNYRHIPSNRPYDNPLQVMVQGFPPVLMVAAGAYFAPRAMDWLTAARDAYAHRPDVAAFALDSITPLFMPDDLDLKADDEWTPMKTLPKNDAFLYRACPLALAIMFNDQGPFFQPWLTFYDWINARKSEWYRYPSGPGIDDTPFSMGNAPESNWTQGTWNVWFSQFIHEHKLGIVYPNIKGALVASIEATLSSEFSANKSLYNDLSEWKLGDALPIFLGDGLPEQPKSIPREIFEALVEHRRNVVSLTTVDGKSIRMAYNWLCNVDGGGFRPPAVVWAATDTQSHNALQSIADTTTIRISEGINKENDGQKSTISGQWDVLLKRTTLISEILNQGIAVFVFDLDTTWLQNPFPYFDELASQGADLIGTLNDQSKIPTNFLYLLPTIPTRRLWSELNTTLHETYRAGGFSQNNNESHKDLQIDQDLFTELLLGNSGWREAHPFTFMTVGRDKVVDSQWHATKDDGHYHKGDRGPLVVNNDQIFDAEEKIARVKTHGMWFWDDKRGKCLNYLVQSVLLVYGKDSSAS